MNTIARITLLAAASVVGVTACTVELDSDRADARRIAERAERAIERTSRRLELEAANTELLLDAMDLVRESAELDDLDDVELDGIVDLDGDGLDDDGLIELTVDDAHACLYVDVDGVSFDVGEC